MTFNNEELLNQVLVLPPDERIELIEKALESLEATERAIIDALWAEEVEDRIQAYERGELKSISREKVNEEIQELVKSIR